MSCSPSTERSCGLLSPPWQHSRGLSFTPSTRSSGRIKWSIRSRTKSGTRRMSYTICSTRPRSWTRNWWRSSRSSSRISSQIFSMTPTWRVFPLRSRMKSTLLSRRWMEPFAISWRVWRITTIRRLWRSGISPIWSAIKDSSSIPSERLKLFRQIGNTITIVSMRVIHGGKMATIALWEWFRQA